MKAFFAAIPAGERGPSFGIGTTHSATMRDARRWIPRGEPIDDLRIVEITKTSYDRIRRGNPGAVEQVAKARGE